MTEIESEFKEKFENILKKLNVKECYIERIDEDHHYCTAEMFESIFNKYTGKIAYTIYDSNDYEEWENIVILILFTNGIIKDEDIHLFTDLIVEYMNIEDDKLDILNFLPEEFELKNLEDK